MSNYCAVPITIEQGRIADAELGECCPTVCECNRVFYVGNVARVLADATELGSAINNHRNHARGLVYANGFLAGSPLCYGIFPSGDVQHAGRPHGHHVCPMLVDGVVIWSGSAAELV